MNIIVSAIFLHLYIVSASYDVPVIIAGKYQLCTIGCEYTYYKDVYAYSKNTPESDITCKSTNEPPYIPDLPTDLFDFGAVFLPDYGINICGGKMGNGSYLTYCYRYDPRVGV